MDTGEPAVKTIAIKHLGSKRNRIGGAILTIDGQKVSLLTDAGLKWCEKQRRFHFFYTQHSAAGEPYPQREDTFIIENFRLTVE